MSGLMSAIPGLSMHQAAAPPPPVPGSEPFDRARADRLMRDAISLLNSFYPVGAMEWLRANRPDISALLEEGIGLIDRAVLSEDIKAVSAELERYVKMHRRAFEIYEQRPPVVEVQETLL